MVKVVASGIRLDIARWFLVESSRCWQKSWTHAFIKQCHEGNRQIIQKLDKARHARMEQRLDFTIGYEE